MGKFNIGDVVIYKESAGRTWGDETPWQIQSITWLEDIETGGRKMIYGGYTLPGPGWGMNGTDDNLQHYLNKSGQRLVRLLYG